MANAEAIVKEIEQEKKSRRAVSDMPAPKTPKPKQVIKLGGGVIREDF